MMKFIETKLRGAYIIDLDKFEEYGLVDRITQANTSLNRKAATLRGMHYQVTYRNHKRPFRPGTEAALPANDIPGNRSIAPYAAEFHSRRGKHARFFSTAGSIPDIRHDESLPR